MLALLAASTSAQATTLDDPAAPWRGFVPFVGPYASKSAVGVDVTAFTYLSPIPFLCGFPGLGVGAAVDHDGRGRLDLHIHYVCTLGMLVFAGPSLQRSYGPSRRVDTAWGADAGFYDFWQGTGYYGVFVRRPMPGQVRRSDEFGVRWTMPLLPFGDDAGRASSGF
jgi:hypothetical protein